MGKLIDGSSLFIKERSERFNEESRKYTLSFTGGVRDNIIVRITGGCGYMSEQDAKGLYKLFVNAFCPEFAGAIIFGGTRMLKKDDPQIIVPGITEIPSLIVRGCLQASALGIIPMTQDIKYNLSHGLIVSQSEEDDYVTVVHPEQKGCLMVQQSVDERVPWDIEYKECMEIIKDYRHFANWQSLLISYNGGGTTEKEIVATAKMGWPIILINGSGRKTEEYANNQDFLKSYPNVHVVEKEVSSLKEKLFELGVISRDLSRVISLR